MTIVGDEETQEQRIQRYVRDYRAETIAGMCVEMEDARPSKAVPKLRAELRALKRAVADFLDAINTPEPGLYEQRLRELAGYKGYSRKARR